MPIDWIFNDQIETKTDLEEFLTLNTLLLDISREAWEVGKKAGYIWIYRVVESEYFLYKIIPIRFGKSSLLVDFTPYKIAIEPENRLNSITPFLVKISQVNSMFISNQEYAGPVVGSEVLTEVDPIAANAPDPVFVLSPAKPRKSILIRNTSNRPMKIKLGAKAEAPPLTAAGRFVEILAGSSYTVLDYSGEICGVMTANPQAGSKITIHELPLL